MTFVYFSKTIYGIGFCLGVGVCCASVEAATCMPMMLRNKCMLCQKNFPFCTSLHFSCPWSLYPSFIVGSKGWVGLLLQQLHMFCLISAYLVLIPVWTFWLLSQALSSRMCGVRLTGQLKKKNAAYFAGLYYTRGRRFALSTNWDECTIPKVVVPKPELIVYAAGVPQLQWIGTSSTSMPLKPAWKVFWSRDPLFYRWTFLSLD